MSGPWQRSSLAALALLGVACATQQGSPGKLLPDGRLMYPETKTVDQVDTLHGIKVIDPYRWLENADAPETRAWVKKQNQLTFEFLDNADAGCAACG